MAGYDLSPVEVKFTADMAGLRRDMEEMKRLVKGSTEEAQKAASGVKLDGSLAGQLQSIIGRVDGVGAAFSSLSGIARASIALGPVVALKALSDAALDGQIQLDRLRNTLTYTAGSSAGAAKEMDYVREISARLGLELSGSAAAYGKLATSAKGTALAGAQVKSIFEAVAKASVVMGLSQDETNGALLAISQMMSKGTVRAEELRGQLGERLPGAFQLAAQAMGTTTAGLNKMLEMGQVVTNDFLPKFAAELDKSIGQDFVKAADSAQAATNRMQTAWVEMKMSLAEAGGAEVSLRLMRGLTVAMNDFSLGVKLARERGWNGFWSFIAGTSMIAGGAADMDIAQTTVERLRRLAKERNEILSGGGKLADSPTNYYGDNHIRAVLRERRLAEIQREMYKLSKGSGQIVFDLKKDYEAAQNLQQGIYDEYLKAADRTTPAQKMATAMDVERAAFEKAVAGLQEGSEAYLKAQAAFELKKADIQKKYGKDERQLAAVEFAARAEQARVASETEMAGLEARHAAGLMSERQYLQDLSELRQAAVKREISGAAKQAAASEDPVERVRLLEKQKTLTLELGKIEAATAAKLAAVTKKEAADVRKVFDDIAKGYDAAIKSMNDDTANVKKNTEQLRDQAIALRYGNEALKERWVAALDASLAEKKHELTVLDAIDQEGSYAQALRASIAALEDQKAAYEDLSLAQKAADQRKQWEDLSKDIERSLTDALMRGFESGNSFGKNFVDTLKNTLKTAALKVVVQAIVDPVMGGVQALGGGGVGGSGSGGMGSLAGSVVSPGSLIGQGALSLAGTSALAGTSGGAFLSGVGATLTNGMGIGSNLSASASLINGGSFASGFGMAAPYVLAALAVADAVGLFGKRGGPQQGQYGTLDAAGYSSQFTMSGGDALNNQQLATAAYAQAQALFSLGGKSASGLTLQQGYKLDPQGSAAGVAYRNLVLDGKTITGGTFDGNRGAQWVGGSGDAEGAATYLAKLTSAEIEALVKAIDDTKLTELTGKLKANFGDLVGAMEKYGTAQTRQQAMIAAVLTDEEQQKRTLAAATESVSSAFASLNLEMPNSTAAFRDLIAGIDLTTQAGQDMLAQLDAIGPGFLTLAEAMRAADQVRQEWQDKLDVITGKTTAQQLEREKLLASVTDEATQAIMRQVWALEDMAAASDGALTSLSAAISNMIDTAQATEQAASAAVDKALSALTSAIDAEKKTVLEQVRAQERVIAEWGRVSGSLQSAIDRLMGASGARSYEQLQAEFAIAIAAAKAGDSTAAAKLAGLSQELVAMGSEQAQSAVEQRALQIRTANKLSDVDFKINDDFISTAQRQLDAANAQLTALDEQARLAREQVDVLRGIDTSVLSVADAVTNLQSAIANWQSAAQQTKQQAQQQGVAELYAAMGRTPDAEGLAYWQAQLDSGKSFEGVLGEFQKSAAFVIQNENAVKKMYASIGKAPDAEGFQYWVSRLNTGEDLARVADAFEKSAAYVTQQQAPPAPQAAQPSVQQTTQQSSQQSAASQAAAEFEALLARSTANEAAVKSWYASMSLPMDDEGFRYWVGRLASGELMGEVFKAFEASVRYVRGYAKGGYHSGGLRLVGERGPELEVTGPARYYSHTQTADLLRGRGAGDGRLAEELKQLREENRAQARALVALQTRIARLLERWDGDGIPEERAMA